jgi:hypothetical protein
MSSAKTFIAIAAIVLLSATISAATTYLLHGRIEARGTATMVGVSAGPPPAAGTTR